MAGINGLALGFRSDANVRVNKFSVMVKSSANTSTQKAHYAAVPGGQNASGVLGVLTEHFVEPNYFVPQGTSPTTVTGTTPLLYNLTNHGMTLQVNGVARCICGVTPINQGDVLIVADNYGRVQSLATSGLASNTAFYAVGTALHGVTNVNDIVQVNLEFTQGKV
jgi:hypothetical protein